MMKKRPILTKILAGFEALTTFLNTYSVMFITEIVMPSFLSHIHQCSHICDKITVPSEPRNEICLQKFNLSLNRFAVL